MRRTVALAFAAMLICASSASAGGRVIPAGHAFRAGPALDGGALTWAGASRGRYFAERVEADGTVTRRDVGPAHTNTTLSLAASDGDAAVAGFLLRCASAEGCKYGTGYETVEDSLYVAASPTGAFALTEGCTSARSCEPCNTYESLRHVVALSDHAVANSGGCGRTDVVVRDLVTGTTRAYGPEYGAYYPWALAGRYLAYIGPSGSRSAVVVVDWRSGEELYHVDLEALATVDLRDDGLVVVADGDSLSWASSESPTLHPIVTGRQTVSPRIAGDLVAFRAGDRGPVEVVRLDGQQVAATDAAPDVASALDFDGQRVAWPEQACGGGFLVEWDLQGAAPSPPPGECGAARPDGRLRITRDRRVALRLTCPGKRLGCHGYVDVVAGKRHRRSRDLAYTPFALDAGETRRVTAVIIEGKRCAIARAKHLRVVVESQGRIEYGKPRRVTRKATVAGSGAACRRG